MLWGLKQITGIPYNPQDQAIIERAHSTFKLVIQKQKGGDMGPIAQLQKALLTLNLFKFKS